MFVAATPKSSWNLKKKMEVDFFFKVLQKSGKQRAKPFGIEFPNVWVSCPFLRVFPDMLCPCLLTWYPHCLNSYFSWLPALGDTRQVLPPTKLTRSGSVPRTLGLHRSGSSSEKAFHDMRTWLGSPIIDFTGILHFSFIPLILIAQMSLHDYLWYYLLTADWRKWI